MSSEREQREEQLLPGVAGPVGQRRRRAADPVAARSQGGQAARHLVGQPLDAADLPAGGRPGVDRYRHRAIPTRARRSRSGCVWRLFPRPHRLSRCRRLRVHPTRSACAWRSCTISCWTCAAPSASSSPCATSGRTPTSTPRCTTRRAPRGASRTGTCTPRSSSASAPPRAPSGRCCRSTRPRSSRSTSPSTTSWSRARAPGPTRSSATSAPPTSATATTRSGTPGATASARCPRAAPRRARCST